MNPSTDTYVKDLYLNVRTNHPITVVYTDDPNDTIALTKNAIPTIRDTTDKVYYWSSRTSWTDISDRQKSFAQLIANPTQVKLTDVQKKTPLAFTFSSPEETKAKYPVFIMSLFSVQFKKDVMTLMQELRDFDYMVRNNVNGTYRLIIIANKSFDIPDDYENIFGVVHHKLPTKEELRTMYRDGFLKDYIDGMLSQAYEGDFPAVRQEFVDMEEYAVNTLSGLTERQAKLILFKATSRNHTKKGKLIVSIDFPGFREFLYDQKFKELAKSGTLTLMKPIPMDQVGGLDILKEWVGQRKKAYTPEAKAKGVKRPKGTALIGPSGSGKSYVAEAIAGVLEFPCVGLNLSSIFNKFVGESESNMESIKQQIESMAPCVVFVDEIDKVFAGEGRGSSGDSGVTARVLGKFLSWIQDTQADLFFVVTANRAHNIPPELLRKGRFDEIWSIAFPTAKERSEIINIHLKKRGYTLRNIKKLVEATADFSSAELEHLVVEAILQAFMNDEELKESHVIAEVSKTTPIAVAFKDDIAQMTEWANKHARWASAKEEFVVAEKEVLV